MAEITVRLTISRENYLAWYEGAVRDVLAKTIDGKTVRFPANILRSFVDNSGVNGTFCISFDNRGKFQSIRKIASPTA